MSAFSIDSVTAKDNASTVTFTVTRKGTSAEEKTTETSGFSTSDASATDGVDYSGTKGNLTFASGVTQQQVVVGIVAEAYQNRTTRSFLLQLDSGIAGTGSIVPTQSSSDPKQYLVVPTPGTSVDVPTPSNFGTTGGDGETIIGNNIKWQANTSGFVDDVPATVPQPLTYLRMGAAGADLNEYERVILDSEAYKPKWNGHTGSDKPRETGPLVYLVRPRGLDRQAKGFTDVETETRNNQHLDGLFLYTDKTYSLTVNGESNISVKGNEAHYVQGNWRNLTRGFSSNWDMFHSDQGRRAASGADKVNGQYWSYSIGNARRITISASENVDYTLGVGLKVSGSTSMELSNSVKYQVSNSMSLSVKGLDISGSMDLSGNFDASLFGLKDATSLKSTITQTASRSILLNVAPAYEPVAASVKAAVAAAAGTNAAAAATLTVPAWLTRFESNGEFYKQATPGNLAREYNAPFMHQGRWAMAYMAGISAVLLMTSALVLQKTRKAAALALPAINMDATGITLSAGTQSQVKIQPAGVTIIAPRVQTLAGVQGMSTTSGGPISFTGPAFTANGATKVTLNSGMTTIGGAAKVTGPFLTVNGNVLANRLYGTIGG